MKTKLTIEIFIVIATLIILTIGIIATKNMTGDKITAKEKNDSMKDLTLGVFVPGLLFVIFIFVGVAFSVYFGNVSLLSNANFRSLLVIMSIISILILSIGSYMISIKDNDKMDEETKNSKYTLIAVCMTSIGVGLLITIILYYIFQLRSSKGLSPSFLDELDSFK